MNDDTTEEKLRKVHLPIDLKLAVFGKGSVRHIVAPSGRRFVWCNMFTPEAPRARSADSDDINKPICGRCIRSVNGQRAIIGERERLESNRRLLAS